LALQAGNEVSFRELASLLKIAAETVHRYIQLLERSFIVFRLGSFSRNLRNELSGSNKFYFYDLGIRNSLIRNFNPMSLRSDAGFLWENFCIAERLKFHQLHSEKVNMYFWRTYQQKEIDLIEEAGGKLSAFEFKWNPVAKQKIPHEFLAGYPGSSFELIHPKNYFSFSGITGKPGI
jgi:predicted AAA+ superfamily ATPase